jgi:hypothetical protein
MHNLIHRLDGPAKALRRLVVTRELIAACTVDTSQAYAIAWWLCGVGARSDARRREIFARQIHFNAEELNEYVCGRPGLAAELFDIAGSYRGSDPCAYIEKAGEVYEVGWYDHGRSQIQVHRRFEDAATDFVLAYWHLPRWRSELS